MLFIEVFIPKWSANPYTNLKFKNINNNCCRMHKHHSRRTDWRTDERSQESERERERGGEHIHTSIASIAMEKSTKDKRNNVKTKNGMNRTLTHTAGIPKTQKKMKKTTHKSGTHKRRAERAERRNKQIQVKIAFVVVTWKRAAAATTTAKTLICTDRINKITHVCLRASAGSGALAMRARPVARTHYKLCYTLSQ